MITNPPSQNTGVTGGSRLRGATTGDFSVNGVSLHVRVLGSGPRVLLLHDAADSGETWGRTAELLARDFQVIVPDHRGHGLSDPSASGYGLASLAADTVALMNRLQLTRMMIIGHGLGARIAMTVAASCPAIVSTLVLEDPALTIVVPPAAQTDESLARRRFDNFQWLRDLRTLPADVVLARRATGSPTWSSAECEAWVQSKYQVSPGIWQSQGTEDNLDWRAAMAHISCPTVIIRGQRRGGSPMESVTEDAAIREAIERLRHVNAVQVPGAGHHVHLDQHHQFMAAVEHFLPVDSQPARSPNHA